MDDPSDPRWFPVNYDGDRDQFQMLVLDLDEIGRAPFLDPRTLVADWDRAVWVPRADIAAPAPARPASFLFHTAFCGSTLLARALHAGGGAVALREPLALLEISHASLRQGHAAIGAPLASALDLLARPWAEDGRVLVKPTNSVNRLMAEILAHAGCRSLLLYSGLEDFLLSCCKKLPAAETNLRWMAQHLFHGSSLQRQLGLPTQHPFHFLEASVITWYVQMERYADALHADDRHQIRSLDMKRMLADPVDAVLAAARWLDLPAAEDGLPARVAIEFGRNAKEIARGYDATQREQEKAAVRQRFAPALAHAMRWADEVVAPSVRLPAQWKPLLA